ncbi:MAG: nucleoside diphosphate kinase regulator [Tistlia sp.]|uniref:nucleoside diphosphate kinase regulator n=1 Tax=Tistlia sp. TaxID=3057121 RepID=UPI0034A5A9B0
MPLNDLATDFQREPPVVLDAAYVERLQGLASAASQRTPEVADRLLNEIDRAEVRPSAEVPETVVNIGSLVTFRDEATGRVQTVTLVMPPEADIAERRASILTPIGAALIGLAEGASITWLTRNGETRRLTITAVRRASGESPPA